MDSVNRLELKARYVAFYGILNSKLNPLLTSLTKTEYNKIMKNIEANIQKAMYVFDELEKRYPKTFEKEMAEVVSGATWIKDKKRNKLE